MEERVTGGIVGNEEGEVLLFQHPKWNGLWVVPGGHIEEGETPWQGFVREVKEETGLQPVGITPINVDRSKDEGYTEGVELILHNFRCTVIGIVRMSDEHTEFIWTLPKEALKTRGLASPTRRLIERVFFPKSQSSTEGAGGPAQTKEEDIPRKLTGFEDFVQGIKDNCLQGTDKYKGDEVDQWETIDIMPKVFGSRGYTIYILGDIFKRIMRFLNQRRERDIFKMALWLFFLWKHHFRKEVE